MAPSNPKHPIGARVSTRAILVTSLAECKRRYGSNAKSKVVFGVVEEVVCGQTATARANYTTKARCTLGDTATKVASVNSRSVSLAPVEVVQPAVPQQGVEVEAVVAAQNPMPTLPLAPEQAQQPPQSPQPPQQPTTPPNQPEEHNNHTRSVPDEQQAQEPMTMGSSMRAFPTMLRWTGEQKMGVRSKIRRVVIVV